MADPILLDADSHVSEPLNLWKERLPIKYRDIAPHMETRYKDQPGAWWHIEKDRQPHNVILGFGANKSIEELQKLLDGFSYAGAHRGGWDPAQRLKDMDQDGVAGEILFTSASNLTFWRGIRNDDAYLSVLRAYNEFLAEDDCAASPERLVAMGAIPTHSVGAAVKELEYCARAGLKGVMLNTFPSGKSYPSLEDDRFYAAALDLNTSVTVHVGMQLPDGPLFKYEKEAGEVAFGGDPIRVLTRFGGNSGLNAVQLLLSGVLGRYPKLQIYWAETQVGWLPYYYEQLDDVYRRSKHWMERYFGLPPLEQEPSRYFREHFYWGFIYDPIGVRLRYNTGIDKIMWGNDFPHSAGDWPHSRRVIDEMFAGVPEGEKQRMLNGNAVKFFHLS